MNCTTGADVYPGTGNTITMILKDNGEAIDHSAITRVVLRLDDEGFTEIDSNLEPALFDWSSTDALIMRLGLKDPVIPGGMYSARVTVFDALNPAGVRWTDELKLYVDDD